MNGYTYLVRPELIDGPVDFDAYGYFASKFRQRLPGCIHGSPCLGFMCRTPGCTRTDLTPWCLGGADELPNGCESCYARVVLGMDVS